MANKPTSIFSIDAAKREEEQTNLEAQLTNKIGRTSSRKVRMNIVLPAESKRKLEAAAAERGLSASVLIQLLINDNL